MLGFVDLTSPTTAPPGVYDVVLTYGGGATVKLAAAFTVTGPTLTSITPVGGVNTSPALAFTLAGTHLNGLTTPAVQLKGTGLISGVTVRATALEASSSGLSMKGILDLAVPVVPAGTYDVVLTYGATASVKLAAAFTVANPIPVLTSIAPTTVYAGSTQPLVLTVNGSGFVPSPAVPGVVGSRVKIGARLTADTTYVSATQLTVPLAAADIAVAGAVPITVVNPPLGGGTSAAVNLSVATDTAAPVTVISGADSAWHNTPVMLTLTATDLQSGVHMTQYAIDGAAPSIGTTMTVPAPADGSGDGVQTVSAWSTDWCGNVENPPVTATVNIDTTGPTTSASVPSPVKTGRDTKVKLGYRANDICPKCQITLKIRYASTGKSARTYALGFKASGKNLSYTVRPNLAPGKYEYSVYATDQAGNTQTRLGQKTFRVVK